jgi:hypothetical protein
LGRITQRPIDDLHVTRLVIPSTTGACVTADAGTGKSAIFGELKRRLEKEDLFMLAHAAGASARSPSRCPLMVLVTFSLGHNVRGEFVADLIIVRLRLVVYGHGSSEA